jgi:hypothetical protein
MKDAPRVHRAAFRVEDLIIYPAPPPDDPPLAFGDW